MRLVAFAVEGYRRFFEKTTVKLHGDFVAFVGPNEAGKSSLLAAIAHLNQGSPFERRDYPYRTGLKPTLTWHFELETEDKQLLETIPGCDTVTRVSITKHSDGRKTWVFGPNRPQRNKQTRTALATLLRNSRSDPALNLANDDGEVAFDFQLYDGVLEHLDADPADFGQEEIELFEKLLHALPIPVESESEELSGPPSGLTDSLATLNTSFGDLIAAEKLPSPSHLAVDALFDVVPEVKVFRQADRDLASNYQIDAVAQQPPEALKHLASLAELDLEALLEEVSQDRVADMSTRKERANKKLEAVFSESWNQTEVGIQLEVQGNILHIQARTLSDKGTNRFFRAERWNEMVCSAACLLLWMDESTNRVNR